MDLVGLSLPRPQTLMRLVIAAALTLILLAGGSAEAAEPRAGEESSAEQQLLTLANSSRDQAGMGRLSESSAWVGPARDHSEQMSATNSIFHDPNLSGEAASIGCWKRVGENVGRGFSVDVIHAALMNSPTHRANVLGDFDALGVGVEIAPDGMIYMTQRFLKSCSAPAPVTVEPAPSAPASRPVDATVSKTAAPADAAPAPVAPTRLVAGFPFDLGI